MKDCLATGERKHPFEKDINKIKKPSGASSDSTRICTARSTGFCFAYRIPWVHLRTRNAFPHNTGRVSVSLIYSLSCPHHRIYVWASQLDCMQHTTAFDERLHTVAPKSYSLQNTILLRKHARAKTPLLSRKMF